MDNDFPRIKRLPEYVFAITNKLKVEARARGEEVNSGWNWQATNQGWSEISTISTKELSMMKMAIVNCKLNLIKIPIS
jgi:hypothetical protein